MGNVSTNVILDLIKCNIIKLTKKQQKKIIQYPNQNKRETKIT